MTEIHNMEMVPIHQSLMHGFISIITPHGLETIPEWAFRPREWDQYWALNPGFREELDRIAMKTIRQLGRENVERRIEAALSQGHAEV